MIWQLALQGRDIAGSLKALMLPKSFSTTSPKAVCLEPGQCSLPWLAAGSLTVLWRIATVDQWIVTVLMTALQINSEINWGDMKRSHCLFYMTFGLSWSRISRTRRSCDVKVISAHRGGAVTRGRCCSFKPAPLWTGFSWLLGNSKAALAPVWQSWFARSQLFSEVKPGVLEKVNKDFPINPFNHWGIPLIKTCWVLGMGQMLG